MSTTDSQPAQKPQPQQGPSVAARALLAKKMQNATYSSPTDNLLTPVSQKLNATKKKHFAKPAKPVALFATTADKPKDTAPVVSDAPAAEVGDDDENPF